MRKKNKTYVKRTNMFVSDSILCSLAIGSFFCLIATILSVIIIVLTGVGDSTTLGVLMWGWFMIGFIGSLISILSTRDIWYEEIRK